MSKLIARKNTKKIIILLIAIVLVLTSILNFPMTVAQKLEQIDKETDVISKTGGSLKDYQIKNTPLKERSDRVSFSQRPYTPYESWQFYTSDSNSGYLCQEDYWDQDRSLAEIVWYGLTLTYNGGWSQGNPSGMTFTITFYENNGGMPGQVFSSYPNIEPGYVDTGLSYSTFHMYCWEVNDWAMYIPETGWISIQSTYCPDGSWFLWSGSPEGNLNALQNNESIADNLAFNLSGWPPPYEDIRIDGILQPTSGIAGIITPIINISNIGTMIHPEYYQINVQINSSTIEYNQTQNVYLFPGQNKQEIFPNWTPTLLNNTTENTIVEYSIVATAIVSNDHNQSDNTMTSSFNLIYVYEIHRLFLIGFISNKTEDNSSISFYAKFLLYYDHNISKYNRSHLGEKIIVLKKHQFGFLGKNFVLGKFDGVVFS